MEDFDELMKSGKDDFVERIKGTPPAEVLAAQCIPDDWNGGELLAAGKPATGEMQCNSPGLQGPPGRVHGGYHGVLRVFTILERIPTYDPANDFPCAFHLRMGAALPIGQASPFQARYQRNDDGSWYFVSKFREGTRLDGIAHSLPQDDIIAPERLAWWKDRYEKAVAHPDAGNKSRWGMPVFETNDISWLLTDANTRADEPVIMHRYESRTPGFWSVAFPIITLANIGTMSRALEVGTPVPTFTLRYALKLSRGEIPIDQPVLTLCEKAHRTRTPYLKIRPANINGVEYYPETAEMLMVSEDFSQCFAHGWIDTLPIEMTRAMGGK